MRPSDEFLLKGYEGLLKSVSQESDKLAKDLDERVNSFEHKDGDTDK